MANEPPATFLLDAQGETCAHEFLDGNEVDVNGNTHAKCVKYLRRSRNFTEVG